MKQRRELLDIIDSPVPCTKQVGIYGFGLLKVYHESMNYFVEYELTRNLWRFYKFYKKKGGSLILDEGSK